MDNTEGSRAITKVYKARKNLTLVLTDDQLSVILGSVLGDAYIYLQGKICFDHGQDQKGYLEWKYKILKNLAYPKIAKVVRNDIRSNKTTTSYRFFLRQYFRPLRRIFYQNGRKTVPKEIGNYFSPLLL